MHSLPPAIVDIKHEAPYKVTERHVSPFNSLFDNLQAQDLKRKEEQKKAHEAKKKKDTDNKRKEAKRKAQLEAENKVHQDRLKKKRENNRNARRTNDNGRTRTEVLATEHDRVREITGQNAQGAGTQNTEIGATWDSVSPLQASQYMASKTPVSADRWLAIIGAESSNNPYIVNSLGCYGYLQLHPVHGAVIQMTPQQYLDTAVQVYNSQGLSAWEVVTIGKA